MPLQYDELNVTTREEIYPDAIEHQFFKGAPTLAYLKQQGLHPFSGGSRMQSAFQYRPANGAPYTPGDNWNTERVPSLEATTFLPKYYYSAVVEFKEFLQVQNTGPLAVFSVIDTDIRNSLQTLNAILAVAIWQDGVQAARTKHLNGLSEAFTDGISFSWNGQNYTNYGGVSRNGTVGSSLNSVPLFVGDSVSGVAGSISYQMLNRAYHDCSIGEDEPNLGICNSSAYSYVLNRIEPQQRFGQERDPYYGATAWKFMNARVLKDQYCPSLADGENHAVLGNWLTSTFTSNSSVATRSRLPQSSTSVTVGETFWWVNTRTLMFRVSDDEEHGFGFSGFIPSQFNSRVVGVIKAAVNLQCIAPRLNKLIFGFTS